MGAASRLRALHDAGGLGEVGRGVWDFLTYRLRRLPTEVWRRWVIARHGRFVTKQFHSLVGDPFWMELDLADPGISTDLARSGTHEAHTTSHYMAAIEELDIFVDGDPVILDVGAHVGWYALGALVTLPEARLVAFEPDPWNVARLRRNLGLTHCYARGIDLRRVDVQQAAVSDQSGEVHLDRHYWSSNASISRDGGGQPVTAVTIDDVADGPVHALRIDVEGHEHPVLKGAFDTLSGDHPMVVCVELHRTLERGAVISTLALHGFEIRAVVAGDELAAIRTWDELRAVDRNVQVVAVRGLGS